MMFGLSAFTFILLAAQGSSPGGRITGSVTDATSAAPISGARVTLTMVVDDPGGTFGRRPRQAMTDANGVFTFDGIEPAQYMLNGPIGFAQVGHAPTNDLGEFRIAGLPAGEYRIVAAGPHHGPSDVIQTGPTTAFAPTYFPGTPDQNAARSVTLTPGQAVTGIEFSIASVAAFRVSGVAVAPDGRPSPHAMVTLIPDLRASGSFMPMMAIAGDDGRFEIGQVIAGTYRLHASANEGGAAGGIGAVSFGVADGDSSIGPDITVGAADIAGLRVIAGRR
jgi:hypothetical protein